MADISATNRDKASAIRTRETMLQTPSVNWGDLAKQDAKIEGYEKGLNRLKNYREVYFPNWRELVTEE
jgi:hypothetical protein